MPSAHLFGKALLGLLLIVTTQTAQSLASSSSGTSSGKRLGLLSFDLDDTLFCTSTVVEDANRVMLKRMAEFIRDKKNLAVNEDTGVQEFQAATKTIRQGLSQPITYTDLRKRAIHHELERLTGQTPDQKIVDECFDAWLDERNASAGRNLLPHTLTGLKGIRDRFPEACVGAITNGRGDPLQIEPLREFFEFCVSGEDDGVFPARKPNPGIYEKAIAVYKQAYTYHRDDSHVWIHVGDCLANDVGASAALGAVAVWYAPDDNDTEFVAAQLSPGKQPFYSTASQEDLQERARLAEEAQKKVSVRIESLKELPAAIERVLQEASVGE